MELGNPFGNKRSSTSGKRYQWMKWNEEQNLHDLEYFLQILIIKGWKSNFSVKNLADTIC